MPFKASFYALAASVFLRSASAAYSISESYTGSTFFDGFQIDNSPELNGGFVQYVDYNTATSSGLVQQKGDSIRLGVDSTTTNTNGGRKSVRATSKNRYNEGLYLFDVQHNPGGICGSFPSLWTVGSSWPDDGEIDIIEQINLYSTNQYTLHTGKNAGCYNSDDLPQGGHNIGLNCNQGLDNGFGCAIGDDRQSSFGAGFNANGGGIQAMEWTSSYIHFWFFPRNEIPSDISSGTPKPRTWGAPTADFGLSCSISSNFHDQQIIFMIDFCGDWVKNDWSSSCQAQTGYGSCPEYVSAKPGDFQDAYWEINSVKIYKGYDDTCC